jgi:hypothetical protein
LIAQDVERYSGATGSVASLFRTGGVLRIITEHLDTCALLADNLELSYMQ